MSAVGPAGRPPARRVGAALWALLREGARLDRTQSDPVVALRNAVGVAAPLAIAALTGNAAAGLAPTIGALQTAFADRPGPYRLRLARMLVTAVAAAVTGGLATLLSSSPWASAGLLAVLGLGAGLLLAGGPAATQVGTAGLAAAVILGHLPQDASGALHTGLLVLLGGAGQTVLALLGWPLGRHRPERLALATLLRDLARAARAPAGTAAGPPAAAAIDAVRATLYGLGHDHGPSVESYRVLLTEAERVRREIVSLAALGERLDAERDPVGAAALGDGLRAVAQVLDTVAGALAAGRAVPAAALEGPSASLRGLAQRLVPGPTTGTVATATSATATSATSAATTGATSGPAVATPGSVPVEASLTRRAVVARLAALGGQLRAIVESAGPGAREGREVERPDLPGSWRLRDPRPILRANLDRDSVVLRHAIRLSVLVAVSDLVAREAGVARGYWIPLTALVVLRPDFASTFQRASLRVLGTAVGLLLATGLVHLLPYGQWWSIGLILAFTFGMRLAGPANLGLTAVSLSGLVVVLLALDGVPARDTVVERILATVIGGAVALASVLFVPAWERRLVPVRLAELLEAYRDLARVLTDPAARREDRQAARAASRLARTNAQASASRARSEPVADPARVELAETVLAHSHRVVHALMTVDAVRATVREHGGLAELDDLLDRAADALDAAARAVRGGGPVDRRVGSLRPVRQLLADRLQDDATHVGGEQVATALLEASDRLANAVDTLLVTLRPGRGAEPVPPVARTT